MARHVDRQLAVSLMANRQEATEVELEVLDGGHLKRIRQKALLQFSQGHVARGVDLQLLGRHLVERHGSLMQMESFMDGDQDFLVLPT
ncbi:hypothetical protein D3C72_1998100 [compost metagenome]